MAASIKISELNSLTNLTDVDLFLVSDMETGTSKKVSYSSLKLNVVSDVTSAVTDLTTVVAENRAAAETLIETVRAALQAAVDANASGFAAGDTALDARVDVLEADPVTKAYVDTKVAEVVDFAPESLDTLNELAAAMGDNPNLISTIDTRVSTLETDPTTQAALDAAVAAINAAIVALQADVDQNETDSDAADAALSARVTTLETTVDNLDIDIAPETLNSISELADAMGDDPAFLTTLQGRVSAIENDNATQTELDAAVATLNTSITTGDATVQAALDAYKDYVDDMNLQLMLAYDTPTYIDTLFGG